MASGGNRSILDPNGSYYCGIDGGGTTTTAWIVDANGRKILEGKGKVSNPVRVGIPKARENIALAVISAFESRSLDFDKSIIKGMHLGIAGVSAGSDRTKTLGEIQEDEALSGIPAQITGDDYIALYDVCKDGPGVVLIAGTGAIASGRNRLGVCEKSDGHGALLGDLGSGRYLALTAFKGVARYIDKDKRTTLKRRIFQHFGAKTLPGLYQILADLDRDPESGAELINAFAKVVAEEALLRNDKLAKALIADAGDALGETLVIAVDKLGMRTEAFPVGLCGSLFEIGDLISIPIQAKLTRAAPRAKLLRRKIEPARAASTLAIRAFQTIKKL